MSVKIETIEEGTSTTDDRKVTKVIGAVNKKIIGRRKQKIRRGNRRSETKWILNSGSDL